MAAYFKVQITDGHVTSLTCPSTGCQSQAHPKQVRENMLSCILDFKPSNENILNERQHVKLMKEALEK